MRKDFLTQISLLVDGRNYIGRVTEMTPPKITPKFREFDAGGLGSAIDIPTGQIEKMECDFTIGTYDKELFALFRVTPGNTVPLVMHGAIVKDDGSKGKVVITLRGLVKEIDEGTLKPGDDNHVKVSMTLSYYKKEIDDVLLVEADPLNYRLFIDGEDQLAGMASALGIR